MLLIFCGNPLIERLFRACQKFYPVLFYVGFDLILNLDNYYIFLFAECQHFFLHLGIKLCVFTERDFMSAEIDLIAIGKRIKERRNALNLSQIDIYNQCGVTSGALSRIENGQSVPSIAIFYKLSQVLNCSMDWLTTGISANEKNLDVDDSSLEFLNSFNKLPEEDQDEIRILVSVKYKRLSKKKKPVQSSLLEDSFTDIA